MVALRGALRALDKTAVDFKRLTTLDATRSPIDSQLIKKSILKSSSALALRAQMAADPWSCISRMAFTTSTKLVLGGINANFRVQISMFQHLSRSMMKSSSRKQSLLVSSKFWTKWSQVCNFLKIFRNFWKFCEFCGNVNVSRILQHDDDLVDSENAEKCYVGCNRLWGKW